MNFFKKLFKTSKTSSKDKVIQQQPVRLSLDDAFVHHFIQKGGKFLYATKKEEIISNLKNIITENNWKEIICTNKTLHPHINDIDVLLNTNLNLSSPFFTSCEHLIADTGDILFSSNQLGSRKLNTLTEHFIVYATTSQLVKDTGQALTGIKTNFNGNIPTNISSVKNFAIKKDDDNFMNYGNTNTKNLYLLLFEDL